MTMLGDVHYHNKKDEIIEGSEAISEWNIKVQERLA